MRDKLMFVSAGLLLTLAAGCGEFGADSNVKLPPGPVQVLLSNPMVETDGLGKKFVADYKFKKGSPKIGDGYYLVFLVNGNRKYEVAFHNVNQPQGTITGMLSIGEQVENHDSGTGSYEAFLEMGPSFGSRTLISNTLTFATGSGGAGATSTAGNTTPTGNPGSLPTAGGSAPANVPPPEPVKPFKDEELPAAVADLKSGEFAKVSTTLRRLDETRVNEQHQKEIAAALETLLDEGAVPTRASAATLLEKWATEDNIPALIEALEDEWKPVQSSAAAALGRLKAEQAAEPLAALLEDLSTRSAAAEALQKIGPAAETHVAVYLDNSDRSIRQSAAEILESIATAVSVPALIKALDDDWTFVSSPALKILIRLKDERSIDALAANLDEPLHRDEIVRVLKEFGPRAEKAVAAQLKSDDHFTQKAAAELLKTISTKESVPTLIAFLKEEGSVFSRSAALEALAKHKDERAVEVLAELLTDIQLREEAAKALRDIGAPAEEAVLAQLAVITDSFGRRGTIQLLSVIGTRKSIKPLSEIAKTESDVFVKQDAAQAIQILQRRAKTKK